MTVHPVSPPDARALRVLELDPRRDERWASFVASHPEALVYHHPGWIEVLASEYGQEPIGLACAGDDGALRGVLPLFRARGLPFRVEGQGSGARLSSLPRTPLAGPLGVDRAASAALVAAAVERARADRGAQLQLKVEGPALDGLLDGVVGVPWRPSYVLELPDDPDRVRFGNSRNHGRIVWAIGKAAKQGVVVRAAEREEEVRAWYRLYLETMRSHAIPPRPYRFFAGLWRVLRPRGQMRLLLAEQERNGQRLLLAGSVFLMAGETVFYAYTGARTSGLELRPNDVLQWRAIHDAARDGFRRYDLGEVTEDDQGLIEFKKKWGATPVMTYRYYFPPPVEAAAGALESGSRLRELAGAAWRRLPLRVTALLGDGLYRYS